MSHESFGEPVLCSIVQVSEVDDEKAGEYRPMTGRAVVKVMNVPDDVDSVAGNRQDEVTEVTVCSIAVGGGSKEEKTSLLVVSP